MKRLLLVCNDSIVAALLKHHLSDKFFINQLDNNDGTAIHCKTQRYDLLIISNIFGKGESGMETIPKIRAIDPNIRILLIPSQDITEVEAIEAGADSLLRNPFHIPAATLATIHQTAYVAQF